MNQLIVIIAWIIVLSQINGINGFMLKAQDEPHIFLQTGHTGIVIAMDQSPDERYIVTGSEDHTVKLWDYQTGKEIRTFEGHTKAVRSVMFSPDGKTIVSGGDDGTVRVWNVNNGAEIRNFKSTLFQVKKVHFSSDGKSILAAGNYDHDIIQWDISSGACIKTIDNKEYTGVVAFSPDGKLAVFQDSKFDLKIFDINGEKIVTKLKGHKDKIKTAAFSSDGQYAVTSGYDDLLIVWNIVKGKKQKTIEIKSHVRHLTLSPDGNYIYILGFYGQLHQWDLKNGKLIKIFKNSLYGSEYFIVTKDNQKMIYQTVQGCQLMDAASEKILMSYRGYPRNNRSIALSPDGQYLVMATYKDAIRIFELKTGKEVRKISDLPQPVYRVSFSNDGKNIFSTDPDSNIRIWNFENGQLLQSSKGLFLACAPDNERYVWLDIHGGIHLRNIANDNDKKLYQLSGMFDKIRAYYIKGSLILIGNHDDTLKVIDVISGQERYLISGDPYYISDFTITDDGKFLVSGNTDGKIFLWDNQSGQLIKSWLAHFNAVLSNAIKLTASPDSKFLLTSAVSDPTIKLWDIETGKHRKSFSGHIGMINELFFTANNNYCLSNSYDGSAVLWNISNGLPIVRYVPLADNEWICITPEGFFNASANGAKYLSVRIGNNIYSIDNFFETFYRPDLIKEKLNGIDISQKIVRKITEPIKLPPQVSMFTENEKGEFVPFSENGKYKIIDEYLTVKVIATDVGGGIAAIRVYHNDKITGENTRGMKAVSASQTMELTVMIPLTDGTNKIRAVAASADQTESNPVEVVYTYKKPAPPKPNMYVLGIGINEYMNAKYNLNYCVADCRGFLQAIGEKAAKIFDTVSVSVLLNADAIRDKFFKTVESIQKRIQPEDVFVFFYAGHGIALESGEGKTEFFYVLHDVTQMTDVSKCQTSGLSGDEMRQALKNIKATKQILFVDACNSGAFAQSFAIRGAAEENALAKLSRASGSVVIASTTSTQFAKEFAELNHGVFTYTLLEALSGKASKENGEISVARIKEYIDDYVPQYTKQYKGEAQWPTTYMFGMDFPIGVK